MSNQHIYRAWDKQDERMIVHEQEFIPLKVTSAGVFRLDPHNEENLWNLADPDRFEIMQSTGQRDPSNYLIFEDDILEVIAYGEPTYHRVVWGDSTPEWTLRPGDFDNGIENRFLCLTEHKWKIVGNIYQNPELIS